MFPLPASQTLPIYVERARPVFGFLTAKLVFLRYSQGQVKPDTKKLVTLYALSETILHLATKPARFKCSP